MSLRTKLLLILSAIVMGATVWASVVVYTIACRELERGAEQYLQATAALLSDLVQKKFDGELREFEHWAAMPMVVQTALDYENPDRVTAFNLYFSEVVAREPYSSIYLIIRTGDCVASDDPRRIYHPHSRNVISKLPSALAGFSGTAGIGRSKLSVATGRPIVPLTAPVWHDGRVVAILRTSVDMGRLSQEFLKPLHLGHYGRIYLFDPSIRTALPKGHQLQTPKSFMPYQSPPEGLLAAFNKTQKSVFQYHDTNREYLVSASRLQNPSWVFFVSQPMDQIRAPVRALGEVTAVVVALTLGLLVMSIFRLTAPVVRGVEQCRRFATDIRGGHLHRRLQMTSSDEVGQLGRELNEMAAQLQLNHEDLAEAERKYRGIFETAVDSIFHTNEEGTILVANPALAALLGASSPADLVGRNVTAFYAERQRRVTLLKQLEAHGEVNGFDIDIRRVDGTQRKVVLHARIEHHTKGGIRLIRGIMQDVTKQRQAEAQAQRARGRGVVVAHRT